MSEKPVQFKLIKNSIQWDTIVKSLPTYSFLLSSARYKYNAKAYIQSKKIAVFVNDKPVGISPYFVIKRKEKFMYCQHGPLFNNKKNFIKYLPATLNHIKQIANEQNCWYIRLSPLVQKSEKIHRIYDKLNLISAPIHNIDALITQHINLEQPMENLLSQMRKTTRYNVRKVLKDKNFTTKIYTDNSQLNLFFKYLKTLEKRKGYHEKPHSLFRQELLYYIKNKMLYTIVGYFKKQPAGIWLNVKFGKYFVNYQAILDTQFKKNNSMLTYQLFYNTLELGKKQKCKILDLFGGMVPQNTENHPWKGIDLFKRGLGGEKITYTHIQDLPLKPHYYISYLYRYYKTKKAGYSINW